MDTLDRPDSNLPARLPASANRLPVPAQVLPRELALTPAPPSSVNSRMLLRGLTRYWWQILLLWLCVSGPLACLIYTYVAPTYEAFSTIQIEPGQPELFNPGQRMGTDARGFEPQLETQVQLIQSNLVLEKAVSNFINGLKNKAPNLIKDPKAYLRRELKVQIVPNSYFIKVSLSSNNQYDASAIVNAVVDTYLNQNRDYKNSFNESLKKNLQTYLADLDAKIAVTQKKLTGLAELGVDPGPLLNLRAQEGDESAPAFKSITHEQHSKTADQLFQNDLALIDAESLLQAKLQAQTQANQNEQTQPQDARLQDRIAEEFQKDPEVVALIEQIEATKDELEHTKKLMRSGRPDPALVAATRRLTSLEKKYNDLWYPRSEEIRKRLLVETGASGSIETINEVKTKVDTLKARKANLIELLKKVEIEKKQSSSNTVQATFWSEDLHRLTSMHDLVNRKFEQVKFETDQERVRVSRIDRAEPPTDPSNDKRWKYMAVAPVGVLVTILGLFLFIEVKAERVADPDTLSSRVNSEVFALPPLPTARAIRNLPAPETEDQIDRFIQRLDHLRFAVCGDRAELGKGRCVLITSAIGGEGKTTLAAQLAARCGRAGISTLLIDADFRKGALCSLLDVPEGPGLSDVLKEEIPVEEAMVPVQGGAFHLLGAGTPTHDTSRILQGRNFGLLIARLRQVYDLIVIDSPPVLPVPDALIMGRWVDGAVLASRYDVSRFPQVERARRQLDNAGIAILGTVINGMRATDSYYGRYTYSHRRTSQSEATETI